MEQQGNTERSGARTIDGLGWCDFYGGADDASASLGLHLDVIHDRLAIASTAVENDDLYRGLSAVCGCRAIRSWMHVVRELVGRRGWHTARRFRALKVCNHGMHAHGHEVN